MFKIKVSWPDGHKEVKVFETFIELMEHLLHTPSFHLGMVKWTIEPVECESFPELPKMKITNL